MPTYELTLQSILSTSETILADQIKSFLKEAKVKYRLLYQTQPSTFIRPEWARGETDACKRSLFEGLILFSLVKGNKNSRLILAIIDEESPFSGDAASLLQSFQIPVYLGPIGNDFQPLENFLRKTLDSGPFLPASRPVTNESERWLLNMASFAADHRTMPDIAKRTPPDVLAIFESVRAKMRKKYRIFHEVALPAIIDFDSCEGVGIDIDWSYAKKARLDLLVTSDAPEYQPLMAIEFDGPTHNTDSGVRKDRKKEAILQNAGLPLLRISYEDGPLLHDPKVTDIATLRATKNKELLLVLLIRRCVEDMHWRRIEMPVALEKLYYSKARALYEEKLEQQHRISGVLQIPKNEKERLAYDALLEVENGSPGGVEDWIDVEEHFREEMREHELEPTTWPELAQHGAVFGAVQYQEFEGNRLMSSVSVEVGECRFLFNSPVVGFQGIGFDNFNFRYALKQEMHSWLMGQALSWLRNRS